MERHGSGVLVRTACPRGFGWIRGHHTQLMPTRPETPRRVEPGKEPPERKWATSVDPQPPENAGMSDTTTDGSPRLGTESWVWCPRIRPDPRDELSPGKERPARKGATSAHPQRSENACISGTTTDGFTELAPRVAYGVPGSPPG